MAGLTPIRNVAAQVAESSPSWGKRIRDRIEGLVPPGSAVSINTHIAVGAIAGTALIVYGAKRFPMPESITDPAYDKLDWYRSSTALLAGAGGLTFVITAGHQMFSSTHTRIPEGVLAPYSLGFGLAVVGAGLIGEPLIKDMEN